MLSRCASFVTQRSAATLRAAPSTSMATEKIGFRPIEPETDLNEAEPLSILYGAPAGAMQPDQDYRLLEHSYRNSPEYAAMVERYPLLRSLISASASFELVGHPAGS